MAVIVNQQDSTNPANPGVGNTSSAGSVAPVSGTGGPMGAGPVAPVSSGPTASSSGQFTNLQKYISANQGAGQNMANQISGRAENQATTANNNINQANTMIGSQLDAEKNRIANA